MTYLESIDGKSITVRNVEYTIEVMSEEEIYQKAGQEVFGCASYKDSKIYLAETMNDDRAYQTFIHELLHVMFFEAGHIFDNEAQEEQTVNALSLLMYDMIQTGHLTLELDSVDPEIVATLAEENDKKTYVKPLFKLPQFFKDKTPSQNINYEDAPHGGELHLVKTLWNTYTVDKIGKDTIMESLDAYVEGECRNIFDYQTQSRVKLKVSDVTEIVPLSEKPKEDKHDLYVLKHTMGQYYVVDHEDYLKYLSAVESSDKSFEVYDYTEQSSFSTSAERIEEVVPLRKKNRGGN
ncbi:zinc-dependent metalloprotease [Bacillus phage Blastoid]|uniref:Zinc-dependent metalloprotease n=1 Tax=Bacillus phage Blastoid TaxID=2880540 RepID=U5PSK3_9CAUD|nr:peptidase [Bacillus phage Blastoid]AGY46874.1 zinc-dependent metalloprotease [Bacillus phage Blastoid]